MRTPEDWTIADDWYLCLSHFGSEEVKSQWLSLFDSKLKIVVNTRIVSDVVDLLNYLWHTSQYDLYDKVYKLIDKYPYTEVGSKIADLLRSAGYGSS